MSIPLAEYNLVVAGDYVHEGGSVWGKTFIGGDLNGGASEFAVQVPAAPVVDSLQVVGDINAGHVVDIIHAGDKVLVPVLSSPTDIKACLRFLMELYRSGIFEAGIRMGMVANRSREHTRYYKILIEFLERLESPLVANLRDTQNYVRAMDRGLTIFDLPESRVAADLAQWQPIFDWLDVAPPANPIRTEEVLAG